MSSEHTAIGGYFELDRGGGRGLGQLEQCHGFQSARAAVFAVLSQAPVDVLWAPNYVCGALNDALRASGASVKRYSLTNELGVPGDLEVRARDRIVVVDYFGLASRSVRASIVRHGESKVIVDAAQSLFFPYADAATTIFSPRKFVGVPDGGFVSSRATIPSPESADEDASIRRCAHLLKRLAGDVEGGYADFQRAETSLSDMRMRSVSRLTLALLGRVDGEAVQRRRVENYRLLQELLEGAFEIPPLPNGCVPLCCPVAVDSASIVRPYLAEQRIYTPNYWPDAEIPASDAVALRLRDFTVYLPCDQRYGESHMRRVARTILASRQL